MIFIAQTLVLWKKRLSSEIYLNIGKEYGTTEYEEEKIIKIIL